LRTTTPRMRTAQNKAILKRISPEFSMLIFEVAVTIVCVKEEIGGSLIVN